MLDQSISVFFFTDNSRSWIVDIGEDHAGTTEDIILQGDVVIDRDIVLDLAAIADHHPVSDKDILAERTSFPNDSS